MQADVIATVHDCYADIVAILPTGAGKMMNVILTAYLERGGMKKL